MAQVDNDWHEPDHPRLSAKNESVSLLAAGNTTLLTLNTRGISRLFVQFSVITQALDAFIISGKAHADATAISLYSVTGDYTSPGGALVDASGNLTAQAAGTSGWFIMNVEGIEQVVVEASAAVDSAVVSAYASGS